MKRIITIVLATMTLFSASSCMTHPKEVSEDLSEEPIEPVEEICFEDTDSVLADHGISDYKIVVPKTASWQITQAKDELSDFFAMATGVNLGIETDDGKTFDQNDKVISLGHTTIASGSGLTLSYEEYGNDGYYIKTFGNTVVIGGAQDNGTMYGIYDFLYYNLGVKFWAETEITIPDLENSTVYLKDMDYKSIPDIKSRVMNLSYNGYSVLSEYRMRLDKGFGSNWLAWGHTFFQLMPPSKYQAQHPDWYASSGNSLCTTNEEMIAELINVMKEKILNSSVKHGYFMIGQEDGCGWCTCDKCEADAAQHGGKAGRNMRFINQIADVMNPWVEETFHGEREYKWIVFAYSEVQDPPVKRNADGSYDPYDSSVVAHENVGIMIAPLAADWAHSMLDVNHNSDQKFVFEGWQSITKEFYIWTYSVMYDNLFVFMDQWSTLQDTYKLYYDIGANYIFDQPSPYRNTPFFDLNNYVRSKLLWDVDMNIEKAIDDFIDVYYKAGAPKVKEYFDSVRARYKIIEKETEEKGDVFHIYSYSYSSATFDVFGEESWPKDWCLNGIRIFDEALALCENMPDGKDKENAINRIKAERMAPIYLLMEIYKTSLSDREILYYANEFREAALLNSIEYYAEWGDRYGYTINNKINSWLSQIG